MIARNFVYLTNISERWELKSIKTSQQFILPAAPDKNSLESVTFIEIILPTSADVTWKSQHDVYKCWL